MRMLLVPGALRALSVLLDLVCFWIDLAEDGIFSNKSFGGLDRCFSSDESWSCRGSGKFPALQIIGLTDWTLAKLDAYTRNFQGGSFFFPTVWFIGMKPWNLTPSYCPQRQAWLLKAHDTTTCEAEAGKSGVQGWSQLHWKFEASLGHKRKTKRQR